VRKTCTGGEGIGSNGRLRAKADSRLDDKVDSGSKVKHAIFSSHVTRGAYS